VVYHAGEAHRELAEDLRWLGTQLAPARDAEMLAGRITDAIHALPAEQVLGPVAARVTRRFARTQADGRDRLTVALDSQRYLRLQERLDALLDDPPFKRAARLRAKSELPTATAKSLRRTERCAPADDAAHTDRDTALHEMRKAKRARYVIEGAEPVLGTKARKLRKRVKTVQSLFSDHDDTVVARPVLRDLGAQAQVGGSNGFTFGVLLAEERAAGRALKARLPEAWAKVNKACWSSQGAIESPGCAATSPVAAPTG